MGLLGWPVLIKGPHINEGSDEAAFLAVAVARLWCWRSHGHARRVCAVARRGGALGTDSPGASLLALGMDFADLLHLICLVDRAHALRQAQSAVSGIRVALTQSRVDGDASETVQVLWVVARLSATD